MRHLLLVVAATWAGIAHAASMTVEYRTATTPPLPCGSGIIIAAPFCAEGTCNLPKSMKADWTRGSGPVTFHLDNSVSWQIGLDAKQCWAPEIVIEAGETAGPRSALVWPAATIQASLIAEKGLKPPANATITIDNGEVRPSATCRIEDGRLTCRGPAMTGDVRLEVSGFAPVYIWNRTIAPKTALGVIDMKRAASLSGRIAIGRRGEKLAGTTVIIKPSLFAQTREEQRQIEARTRRTNATATGLFQFADLDPGRYEVRATKEGWSPSETVIMTVAAGREAALPRTLMLEPLIDFEVMVTPALAPDGQTWIVRVKETTDVQPKSIESRAGVDGRWSTAGLQAGSYTVTVLDRAGTTFFERGFPVTPAHSRIALTVDSVAVRGRLKLGDEPLAGSVRFGRFGGKQASFRADDEGLFTGVLPGEGKWDVDVIPNGKQYGVRAPAAEVRRASDGFAEVEIELENGRVTGRVVDEKGKAVTAVVHVYEESLHSITFDRTASDGTFDLIGLPVGDVKLRAAKGDSDTGLLPHRVGASEDEPVTLVLRRKPSVRGWVVTSSGRAVSGATIRYWSDAFGGREQERVTGPDGEFELSALPSDPDITVTVVAPPLPVKIVKLVVDGELKELVLDRISGTLFVKARSNLGIFIRRGPATASLNSLLSPKPRGMWSPEWTPRGYSLSLEPGHYLVCRTPFASAHECQAVSLAAGGEQSVTVDNVDQLPEDVR